MLSIHRKTACGLYGLSTITVLRLSSLLSSDHAVEIFCSECYDT